MKRPVTVAVVLTATLLLAGCVSGLPSDHGSRPSSEHRSPSPSSTEPPTTSPVTAASASPGDDDYVPPPAQSDECHPWDFTSNNNPEQVTGWAIQVAVDGGPQKYATGTATLGAGGVPVAYKVAPGDIYEFISRRFCINLAYLYTINSVRRADAQLYAGDTLNLDSHTILTVGTENGRSYDTTPHPEPIPPQH